MNRFLLGAAALVFGASAASAAISVDGVRDADYGAARASVGYSPNAAESNFGTPENVSKWTSYDIYGAIQGDNLYGFWQADPNEPGEVSLGNFVNLYLDTNPDVSGGSDLGFEITNKVAFRPTSVGPTPTAAASDIVFAAGTNSLEFLIPLAYLRDGVSGLPNTVPLVAPGGRFTFRLSQAFGYSVAGGASYGVNRLGSFVMPTAAVPEPAAWALMIAGFGLAGAAMRRRVTLAVV